MLHTYSTFPQSLSRYLLFVTLWSSTRAHLICTSWIRSARLQINGYILSVYSHKSLTLLLRLLVYSPCSQVKPRSGQRLGHLSQRDPWCRRWWWTSKAWSWAQWSCFHSSWPTTGTLSMLIKSYTIPYLTQNNISHCTFSCAAHTWVLLTQRHDLKLSCTVNHESNTWMCICGFYSF